MYNRKDSRSPTKPIANVALSLACAIGCDARDEPLPTRAGFAGEGEEEEQDIELDDEEQGPIADSIEYPVASIELPNGTVLDFFASEIDGGSGVIEYGGAGQGSVLANPLLEEASALEIFIAVTDGEVEIPEELLAANVPERPSEPMYDAELTLIDAPRGWHLAAFGPTSLASSTDTTLWASWCDTWAEFDAEICDTNATYTVSWCHGYTDDYQLEYAYAYNFRGAQCAFDDWFAANLGWQSLNGSCGSPGNTNEVWGSNMYEGGWFSYTWNGANRKWTHHRSNGVGDGFGRMGHKWKPC